MDAAGDAITGRLEEIGAEFERRGERVWAVRLPSSKRGAVGTLIEAGERTLALRAFVMRAPDRGHEGVYRRMLAKNLELYAWRFALDGDGDVYLAAQVPLAGLDAGVLDELLGAACTAVDETYESLVRTGFDVPEGTVFGPPPGEAAGAA